MLKGTTWFLMKTVFDVVTHFHTSVTVSKLEQCVSMTVYMCIYLNQQMMMVLVSRVMNNRLWPSVRGIISTL